MDLTLTPMGMMTKSKNTLKVGLTPRQLDIYKEVVDFIRGNKYSPSYEEIKQLANLRSKSEVHRYVHQLERRGWIRLGNGRNRSISII
jgi:SOS-response transcriptional repressor LexA